EHRARRARTEVRAEHGIECQRAFEERQAEALFEQIVHAHAADAQQLAHVASPEPADAPAEPEQRTGLAPAFGAEARRRVAEHRMQRAREAAREPLPVSESFRVDS